LPCRALLQRAQQLSPVWLGQVFRTPQLNKRGGADIAVSGVIVGTTPPLCAVAFSVPPVPLMLNRAVTRRTQAAARLALQSTARHCQW
jgi:hypothetical protein